MLSKDGNNTFDRSTDSLEAIRDALDSLPVWSVTGSDLYYTTGSVGIGTTSPGAALDIAEGKLRFLRSGTPSNAGFLYYDGHVRLGTEAEDSMGFYTNNSIKIMVKYDGNVGIGTTSPDGKLHVIQTVADEGIVINRSTHSWNLGVWTDGLFEIKNLGESTTPFVIENNGNVGIAMTNPSVALDVTGDIEYTGTITDVSDQRLKENIVGINNPILKIQGINGVYFNMIGSDKRELGVIAQNVQQVLPEAVSIVDPENGYLGVDYTSLVPVLIEAIKEQQRQIQALRQDIEQLERNL